MPQLDFYSFPVQTIWFLLSFSFIYIYFLKIYISKISEIFKLRTQLAALNSLEKQLKSRKKIHLYDLHMLPVFKSVGKKE